MNPLLQYHKQHALKLIQVADYEMPQRYVEAKDELQATGLAAMMDRFPIGKLRMSGKDRESLLHRLTTNEMRQMKSGESRVNVFTTAKGKVVDLVEILARDDDYLILTGAGRAELTRSWIDKYTFIEDVQADDLSADLGLISLFGRDSTTLLDELLQTNTTALEAGNFTTASWHDEEIIIHRPEAFSPVNLNLILPADKTVTLWEPLLKNFKGVGFATYETLRILHGIPAAHHEVIEDYNPHEIGLYPLIDFEKGCYIGQEVVARLDTYQKIQRQLVGVKFHANAEEANEAALYREEKEIGKLTSAADSLDSSIAIGLAVVRKQYAQPNTTIELRWPEGQVSGTIMAIPFEDLQRLQIG